MKNDPIKKDIRISKLDLDAILDNIYKVQKSVSESKGRLERKKNISDNDLERIAEHEQLLKQLKAVINRLGLSYVKRNLSEEKVEQIEQIAAKMDGVVSKD